MRVLVACEESQEVCKAFRAKGHEAYSCDIQECSGGHPEWHIKGDALKVLNPVTKFDFNDYIVFETMDGEEHWIEDKWDLIIAHPPCTYMSKAGARWMFPKAGEIDWHRYALAMEAKEFFMTFYNCKCEKVVIENPVPLKCVELPEPTQKIQPYEFDDKNEHPYSKATLLWIKGVPKLRPTTPRNKPSGTWMPSNTGGFSRGQGGGRGIAHDKKTASKTFSGIARAMAEQWG
jgi:hypothetical protein